MEKTAGLLKKHTHKIKSGDD